MKQSLKKIIPILLISVFLVSLIGIFTPAYATSSIIFQNDPAGVCDSGGSINANHPSATALYSAWANNIKAPSNFYLTQLEFWFYGQGDPDGYLYAQLTGVNSQAFTAEPNMSDIKATSTNTVSMAAIVDGSYATWRFYFDGSYQLTTNTYYALVVFAANGTNLSAGNGTYMGQKNTNANMGTKFVYYSSAWHGETLADYSVRVYGDTNPAPTPTPAPNFSLNSQYHIYNTETSDAVNGTLNSTIGWITDYNITQFS